MMQEKEVDIELHYKSTTIMALCRKLLLILWKNWILRKRHYIMTAFELVVPTFLTILIVLLRVAGGEHFAVKYIENSTVYEPNPLVTVNMGKCSQFGNEVQFNLMNTTNRTIMFTPNNTYTFTLMTCMQHYFQSFETKQRSGRIVILQGVENEKVMEELALEAMAGSTDYYSSRSNFLWGGVAFVNDFDTKNPPKNLHYRIRMNGDYENWNTEFLAPPIKDSASSWSQSDPSQKYIYDFANHESFMQMQHGIAMYHMELLNISIAQKDFTAQRFPYPPYYNDQGFSMIMSNMLPLFICLSYVFIAPTLIKRIVCEKELGIKELMKMMGLHGWIQWMGWFLSSFIVMGISAIIIVFLLCCPFTAETAVLNYSSPELIFLTLLLYIAASIAFCFFISCFFSKPSVATGIGCVVWLISFIGPNYSLESSYNTMTLCEKLLLCILPNMGLALSVKTFSEFESRAKGLRWDVLAMPAIKDDNLTMLHIWGMMFVDMFLYFFLTWYMDHVFPGVYGIKKPWYFPFTSLKKSFRSSCPRDSSLKRNYKVKKFKGSDEEQLFTEEETPLVRVFDKSFWLGDGGGDFQEFDDMKSNKNFEAEPVGLLPVVSIKHLSKSFQAGQMAVNNLSLNIYKGQITALLGHNGAGKTTTMSILTGMIPPTKGTALIEGHNIVTDTDKARESVGLCPQHNMLFDILTVKEHLMFFGKLKGVTGSELNNEVDGLMAKLQLGEKQNTFARELSGGMKRKLNLGMALVGGTKVVMLDEPTSGMDPEARRAIWDLLQEFRRDRCILLSTHFMEEADVLGDRIAIMAHGVIQCYGTTMFLKKQFGAGYHLNFSKSEHCDTLKLTNLIQQHLPQSYMENHIANEISFVLLAEDSEKFPDLFQDLESNLESLGINGFGLSVTTMEEVFLKVGEMAESVSEPGSDDSETAKLSIANNYDLTTLRFNYGLTLWLQQFWGLLLKRWHYGRRRWILIVAQVLVPALFVLGILLISNSVDNTIPMEPARVMDMSQYGNTIALYSSDGSSLNESYAKVFLGTPTVTKQVDNVSAEITIVGKRSLAEYNEQYVVGAELESESLNSMYNGLYYHSLPMSVNLIHNALLKQANNNSEEWKIVVENAPLPKNPNMVNVMEAIQKVFKAIVIGVFIPIGLSVMAASFVIFPIHERVTKAKHIQLMTGVGGVFFWGSSFIWDFGIHIIACCCMTIIFATVDMSNIVTGDGQLGVVFFLILMYGWAAIPFSYSVSFISNVPSSGFNKILILNLIAGIVFGLLVYFFKQFGSSDLKDVANILQWFVRLLPIFPVTIGFMLTPWIAQLNSVCKDVDVKACTLYKPQCCRETCGNDCFKRTDYFMWDSPGIGQEFFMLAVDGVLYFLLIFLIERGVMYRLWYLLCACKDRMKRRAVDVDSIVASDSTDSDVQAENERVRQIAITESSGEDALLVHDLTKHFWSFVAVDNLNFGVKPSECFGLLGVNGAGKTTTFRMLTGDETITHGNAYIQKIVLKKSRSKFLQQISYCPQFDALIDYLTGRETLYLFARLRGIDSSQIKNEINKLIETFDLTEHANKITKVYSGGNKRKLSAAIAFLGNRPLVFLDEPTTGVDPVARRKLWNILLAARTAGLSIILTSHSMEECEVLCSRVAIMVNGKFQCMGGIQHLKNKFNEGFTIMAKLKPSEHQESVQANLQNHIHSKFSNCFLKDVHQGVIHFQVMDASVSWTYLFKVMENAKQHFDLEDYSVSQATLEQVFLSFARKQRVVDIDKKTN